MLADPIKPRRKTDCSLNDQTKVEIRLDDIDKRDHIAVLHKKTGNMVYTPLYTNQDAALTGKIKVNMKESVMQQLQKIRIELIGKIEFFELGKKGFNFITLDKDLGSKCDSDGTVRFKFENLPRKYETYTGQLVQIRYILKAIVVNYDLNETSQEQDIALHLPMPPPNNLNIFTLQIGVLETLEVDLEYKKTNYHLGECIVGKVLFNLANLKLKKIELYLLKIENYFYGSKSKIKEEVLKKMTLKDGQPNRGEMIPVKLSLASLNISPTMEDVENRFSVKYFLTLGLIDSNERMFFRKVEITLRRAPRQCPCF